MYVLVGLSGKWIKEEENNLLFPLDTTEPEASPALLLRGGRPVGRHSFLDYRKINTTYCPSDFLCHMVSEVGFVF